MNVTLSIPTDGLLQTLDLTLDRIEDLKPVLRAEGKALRADIKATFDQQGPGWPGLAESTIEKREHTGTSQITKFGKVRASSAAAMERRLKSLQIQYARAMSSPLTWRGAQRSRIREKLEKHKRAMENLQARIEKSKTRAYADRRTGKSVAEAAAGAAESPALTGSAHLRGVNRLRTKLKTDTKRSKRFYSVKAQAERRAVLAEFERLVAGGNPDESTLSARQAESLRGRMQRAGLLTTPKKEGGKLLGKLASSIVMDVHIHGVAGTLVVRARPPWAGIHDKGGTAGHGAQIKQRQFMRYTTKQADRFARRCVAYGLGAFRS